MSDYGWRNDQRRRWDENRARFDNRYGDGLRADHDRNPAMPGNFDDRGRESDYAARYATPLRGTDDLNRRPGGMRDEDWRTARRGRTDTFRDDVSASDEMPYRSYPADYDEYGDWQGQGGYGAPRFGDTYGRAADAYGRGYRNYGTGNYGSYNTGNYGGFGGERRGFTDYGPDYANSRETDRSLWNRASDEVASWVGDDAAARRRDQDRRASHAGRGPKGYTRSDDRIREDVNDRLTDDWYLDATDISVAVNGGEVTLSGTVSSREDKHRAEHLVEDLSGIRHVQNNLRVDESRKNAQAASPAVSTPVGSSNQGTAVTGTHSASGTHAGNNLSSTH